MKFDNNYFSERIKCTDAEKMECLETVKEMVRFNEIACKKGFLALEDVYTDSDFLNVSKEYLIIGNGKAELSEICETFIIVGDYRGKEFLQNMIIAKTLISMAGERDGYTLHKIIPPLFGVGWLDKVNEIIFSERDLCRRNDITL